MTVTRLAFAALAVAALVLALKTLHHSAPHNAPGVTGLTNAIHAAQGVVQQSQQPQATTEP
jgi:hypothetical protein